MFATCSFSPLEFESKSSSSGFHFLFVMMNLLLVLKNWTIYFDMPCFVVFIAS